MNIAFRKVYLMKQVCVKWKKGTSYKLYNQKPTLIMGCGSSNQSIENVAIPGRDLFMRKQLIGVGHHGCVYRCIYHLDNTEHALKLITSLSSPSLRPLPQQQYTSILSSLKQLKHPRIAPYTHTEITATELSIVMELSKEGSLKKYLQKNGKQSQEFASKILGQIVEGLVYLHSMQIWHKDVKSSNVILSGGQGNVKLTDFGVAALYDARLWPKGTQKKEQLFYRGDSVPYMAPEVITSQGMCPKSQVWSVGCIAIELLTGKTPWADISTTFQQVFKLIQVVAYPSFPPDLSPQCQDFLRCCLAVNPSKRSHLFQLVKHPFIKNNVNVKENQLLFEIQQNCTLTPHKNDKENRVKYVQNKSHSKNERRQSIQKMRDENEGKYFSAEKKNKDENREHLSHRKVVKTQERLSRQSIKILQPEQSSTNIVKPIKKVSPTNDFTTLSRQQILPQINEDQQQLNVVILNNKKVKHNTPYRIAKPIQKNMKTQPTQESQRQYRHSINLNQSALGQSFQKEYYNPGKKMGTEPNLLLHETDNKDYFKRPLKLLKKKLNQSKKRAHMNNSSNISNLSTSFIPNQSQTASQLQPNTDNRYNQPHTRRIPRNKIRSNTESSRQQIVIDTQVSRAQRDRYINQQLCMRRQREKEKYKWEQELKKEAQVLKRQLSHRYAYPYPNIPL